MDIRWSKVERNVHWDAARTRMVGRAKLYVHDGRYTGRMTPDAVFDDWTRPLDDFVAGVSPSTGLVSDYGFLSEK